MIVSAKKSCSQLKNGSFEESFLKGLDNNSEAWVRLCWDNDRWCVMHKHPIKGIEYFYEKTLTRARQVYKNLAKCIQFEIQIANTLYMNEARN